VYKQAHYLYFVLWGHSLLSAFV